MVLKTACYTWNDTPTQICIHSSQRGHDLAWCFHHSTLEHRQVSMLLYGLQWLPYEVIVSPGSVIHHFLISNKTQCFQMIQTITACLSRVNCCQKQYLLLPLINIWILFQYTNKNSVSIYSCIHLNIHTKTGILASYTTISLH